MKQKSFRRFVLASIAVVTASLSIGICEAQRTASAEPSSWVRVCDRVAFPRAAATSMPSDGQERAVCLTLHRRFDAATGTVLFMAAIGEVEGSDRKTLVIVLPPDISTAPGVNIGLYLPDIWAAIRRGERVDDGKLDPLKLAVTQCSSASCVAELEATPEVINRLSESGGLIAFSIEKGGAPMAPPVPLNGFAEALAGPPVGNWCHYGCGSGHSTYLLAQARVVAAEVASRHDRPSRDTARKH